MHKYLPLASHRIGLGTWQMGESRSERAREVKAITHALEIGYRLIDTAEMYASGGAEELIGQALKAFGAGHRERITIVSKVLPSNSSRKKTRTACENSIARMDCGYLDVYLLHWQGSVAYEETLEAFIELRDRGLIGAWGVSNFDARDLRRWQSAEKALGVDKACATNQVYYALSARGPSFDLLPDMARAEMPLMAYSPLGSGELIGHAGLCALAKSLGLSAAQLAIAWLSAQPGVIAIPKSCDPGRISENFLAKDIVLGADTQASLDRLFPPPRQKVPLAVI